MNTAIILAGGVGSRVGANVPKQFIEVMVSLFWFTPLKFTRSILRLML